jgi:hypothetical protein
MQERWPGTRHFGLLECPADEALFDARITELRRLGVRPIWYSEGGYTEIRPRLSAIVQRASTARSAVADSTMRAAIEIGDAPKPARVILDSELDDLAARDSSSGVDEMSRDAIPYPVLLDRMVRGELAFFLGAGATMGRLPMAEVFYDTLRGLIQAPHELSRERVTQYFADRYGRGALDAKVQQMLGEPKPAPSALHWFLATLPSRLREKGYHPRPPLILTTNFDDWMERALLGTGERYHMFTFRVEHPHAGYFVYRSADGDVRVIDRPAQFHEIGDDCAIVVKYHGGLHHNIPLPVTYAFTRDDFMQTTRRLPMALPEAVLDRLGDSSLLFLGHGLANDSVEALARELHRRNPRVRSWAIQRPVQPGWPLYWSQIGVDIVDMRLSRFVQEMHKQLKELPAAPAQVWQAGKRFRARRCMLGSRLNRMRSSSTND